MKSLFLSTFYFLLLSTSYNYSSDTTKPIAKSTSDVSVCSDKSDEWVHIDKSSQNNRSQTSSPATDIIPKDNDRFQGAPAATLPCFSSSCAIKSNNEEDAASPVIAAMQSLLQHEEKSDDEDSSSNNYSKRLQRAAVYCATTNSLQMDQQQSQFSSKQGAGINFIRTLMAGEATLPRSTSLSSDSSEDESDSSEDELLRQNMERDFPGMMQELSNNAKKKNNKEELVTTTTLCSQVIDCFKPCFPWLTSVKKKHE